MGCRERWVVWAWASLAWARAVSISAVLRGSWVGDVLVGGGYTDLARPSSLECVPLNNDILVPSQVLTLTETTLELSGSQVTFFQRGSARYHRLAMPFLNRPILSFDTNIVTWLGVDGGRESAFLAIDDESGALIWVRLFGDLGALGVDPASRTSYSEVMRNRATCVGTYADGILWSEFGYFQRPPARPMLDVLRGSWMAESAATRMATTGDGVQTCTASATEVIRASGTVVDFGGVALATTASAVGRLPLGDGAVAEFRFVPFPDETFLAWDPTTGIAWRLDLASKRLSCFSFVPSSDGARARLVTFDVGPGAPANPCDERAYALAIGVDGALLCELEESVGSSFVMGVQVYDLVRNRAGASMLATGLVALVASVVVVLVA